MDKVETEYLQDSSKCITCNTELQGEYCHQCGEKKIIPHKDNSLAHFAEEALDGLMHLDAKFIKTFWPLISKPGFLVVEYNRGHRKPYMKPVQLFVLASVLFYFIFPTSYLFFSSVKNIEIGYEYNIYTTNVFHYDIGKQLQQIATEKHITTEQAAYDVTQEAAHKSKAFLFIILPFFALMFYALFRKSTPYFIPHLILTVYLFSFFIVANLIAVSTMVWLLRFRDANDLYFYCMAIAFFIYILLSVRKVYKNNWIKSVLKSMVVVLWFIVLVLVYRQVITIWAVNSI